MNVYDFDRTVYDGDSSVDFYRFILFRKPYLAALLPYQVWGIIMYLFGVYSKERMKEIFFCFIRYCASLDDVVAGFWKRSIRKIKPWYLRQKQNSDIIISASPQFLLEPLVVGNLGVRLIASQIDKNTGKFIGKNCYGEEKAVRFFGSNTECVIENFYSDSLSDAPLAAKAQKSFIVKKEKIANWDDYKTTFWEKIKGIYFKKDFILFVFCGGMGTLTNFIVSLIVSMVLNPIISYIFGYSIGIFITYAANTKLVIHQKISFIGFVKFIISYMPNFIILFSFVAIFIGLLHWNKVIIYAMAGMLGLPITFLLVKLMFLIKKE